jgi:hypothetical protein
MRQYFGEHRSKFGLRELWRSLHGTNAALDHFEQRSPRGRAVWYWPKSATRDFKTGRRHGQFNGGGG